MVNSWIRFAIIVAIYFSTMISAYGPLSQINLTTRKYGVVMRLIASLCSALTFESLDLESSFSLYGAPV